MAENYIDRIEVDGVERPIRDTSGSVRYDAAQSLTDAQKQQARNNISAMQGIESTDYPGCNYALNGSTVEWINPPMQLGVEYRTTERYLGKPVYVQLVNFGALGNATTKSVDVAIENTDKIPVLGGTALEVPLIPGSYGGTISGISATRTSTKITISITTTTDLSWMQAEVLLGYTKTTD